MYNFIPKIHNNYYYNNILYFLLFSQTVELYNQEEVEMKLAGKQEAYV